MFIQFIGIEFLGINGLFSNILSLLSMADLGFGVAMNYTFYKPLAEKDTVKLAGLITFYRRVYLFIAGFITILGVSIIPFLKYFINIDRDIPHLYVYYCVFLLQTVIGYLFVYKFNIISADQKNYKIDKINTVYALIRTCTQIVVIIFIKNYLVYILIGVLFTLLINLRISFLADREYPYIKNRVKLDIPSKKKIYGNLKSIFIYKISATFMSSIDNILMSMLIGTVAVGIYSNYYIAITSLNSIISMVFGAVTASIGNVVATEGKKDRYKIFKSIQLISFCISAVIGINYCLLINDFVKLWIGKQYLFRTIDVLAISFDLYLGMMMRPLWTFRDATGLYMKTRYIMAIAAFLNIILSVIMGKYWGVAGIVFASSLCRILTYIWYEPIILFKEYFDENVKNYFISLLLNSLGAVILLLVLSRINSICETANWAWWIGKGLIFSIAIIFVYYICYKNTDEYKFIKQRLIK